MSCSVISTVAVTSVVQSSAWAVSVEVCRPSNAITVAQCVTLVSVSPHINTVTVVRGGTVIYDGAPLREFEVSSRVAVPSQGTLYLGDPPTSAAPLHITTTSVISAMAITVDSAAIVAWALEVLDADTSSLLATLTLPAGAAAASQTGMSVSVLQDQRLHVRLSGTTRSAFANARATIEITQP